MSGIEPTGLAALEERLRCDLEWLEFPAKSWVPSRFVDGQRVRDVVIIGAGMAGLVVSGMLRKLGVDNHIVYDQASAGREGPWVTYARMQTLRSPKQLTGPAMGLAALTFRAFYEARFGREAWQSLDKPARTMWMEYLIWYRKVLGLPIQNDTTVVAVEPFSKDCLQLTIDHRGLVSTEYARHIVLATGRDGLGGPFIPEIAASLDKRLYAHSADDIDFSKLAD